MKTSVRKITRQLALYTVTALMGLMVFNKVFYSHSHVKASGVIITHAHPFQKTEGQNPASTHHHTSFEFSILDSFELYWIGFLVILLSIVGFVHLEKNLHEFSKHQSASHIALNDRAPPYNN